MFSRTARAVAAAIVSAALFGACSSARFNTELSAPDGLGPADPVTNLGAKIGSVASVTPLPDGNSAVEFDIDYGDQRLVMQDSIMILRKDTGTPSLELLNTNPISIEAPAGATIEGASNDTEANLLLTSRGLTALNVGTAALAGAAPSAAPGVMALQQQMAAWQSWYAAASARNAAVTQQQINQLSHSVDALEKQLIRAGKSAEAQRLRQDFENFARNITPSAAPSSPNTLTVPPVR